MAITAFPQPVTFKNGLVRDTSVGATAVKNIWNGPCRLRAFRVTNTGGSAALAHLKLYNSLAPTVGTDAPTIIIMVPAGATIDAILEVYSDDGVPQGGYLFTVGFSYACVQEAGTAGTTAPADTITADFDLVEA